MVHIRGDHINFDNYTLFELIESYWVDMFKFNMTEIGGITGGKSNLDTI